MCTIPAFPAMPTTRGRTYSEKEATRAEREGDVISRVLVVELDGVIVGAVHAAAALPATARCINAKSANRMHSILPTG